MSIIYREDFETDGNGTRYTTSVAEFTDGSGDFFTRTDGSTIGSFYEVSGQGGSFYFGAMDINGEPPYANTVALEITGIDISGYSDLTFSGLFAEDDDGTNQDWDENALVYVEVNIDGAGYETILQFAADGSNTYNTEPLLDTDFDGVGDGAALSDVFAEFTADITGTGSSMDVRITIDALDAGDEDIAFDNLTISGTPAEVTVLDETFDDASKMTVSSGFFSDGYYDYLGLTGGTTDDFGGDASPNSATYTGTTDSYLTGQDLDGEGAALPITVEWTGLDITGLNDLTFTGDFGSAFTDAADATDYIKLTASIDGGEEVVILSFLGADLVNGDAYNGLFYQDTDLDGTVDGAALEAALAEFTAGIDGTGNTLDLKLELQLNAGYEDFAVDNFKIIGTSGGTITPAVIASAGDGLSVSEEGETTDTFTLALTTDPTAPVTVTVTAPDGQSLVSTDGVTFAASVDVTLTDTTPVDVTVQAVDDAVDEAAPHYGTLDFTVASTDSDYDGLTVNDLSVAVDDNDYTITLISDIQGAGDASTMVGDEVTVEAVVTGILTDASGVVGYYIQEEDADNDGDASTSEGVYVYNPGATVSVGDSLRLTATVAEYYDLTELTNVSMTQVLGTGTALPTATQITIGMSDDFEAYEGMRVEVVTGSSDPLTVIENYNLDRYGQIVVSEGTQTQPTQIYDPETEAGEISMLAAENAANRLIIDNSSNEQNPDTYNLVDAGDGTALTVGDPIAEDGPTLRLGAEVDSITGIMDYSYGEYRVQVDSPLEIVEGSNDRPTEAPDVGGDLQVASFNVLNLFTTLDDGSAGTGPDGTLDPRGATTAGDLERQLDKIVTALLEMDAEVIALQELENNGFGSDSAIAALVDALNAEAGAGTYAFVDPGTDNGYVGTDAITTGIIYKPAEVTLEGSAVLVFEEESAATTYATAEAIEAALGSDYVGDYQRNRPSVAATFSDDEGNEFTVVSTHLKSKGDSGLEDLVDAATAAGVDQALIDALTSDPNYDQGDGQGFWNGARTDAAVELGEWLDTNPTGASDTSNALIMGDLNAYAKEDPVQAAIDAGFTDLAQDLIGSDAYSYVYDGQQGTLDYGLASAGLMNNITGVGEWHINADEPDLLGYSSAYTDASFYNDDAFAASDHDPMLVGLTLEEPTTVASLSFDTTTVRGWGWCFWNRETVTYSEDGVEVATQNLRYLSREIEVDTAGITISSDDGIHRGRDFLSTMGEGLSVFSTRGDRGWWNRSEKTSIDDAETVTFSLEEVNGLGDATEVEFEFTDIKGSGQVELSFYDDGTLVDTATLDIVDGAVSSYELYGAADFDEVTLGVSGNLKLEIASVDFYRLDADEILFA